MKEIDDQLGFTNTEIDIVNSYIENLAQTLEINVISAGLNEKKSAINAILWSAETSHSIFIVFSLNVEEKLLCEIKLHRGLLVLNEMKINHESTKELKKLLWDLQWNNKITLFRKHLKDWTV